MDRLIRSHQFTSTERTGFMRESRSHHFFPHQVYFLPKAGPDAYKAAQRVGLAAEPESFWEILLFAVPPLLDKFPDALYWDNDVVWHQQHLSRRGLVATANVVICDSALYSNNHLSDLVQRISRRREHKTHIENAFKGWHHLLLNAVMYFALTHELQTVFVPTAARVLSMADPQRRDSINPALFQRVYDGAVLARWYATMQDNWWKLDVPQNRPRIVIPQDSTEQAQQPQKTICVCHDIERGLGHHGIDRRLEKSAEQRAPADLQKMLAIERAVNVRATYNVVAILCDAVRAEIERDGHCLAFHSYDHNVYRPAPETRQTRFKKWMQRFRPAPPPAVDQVAYCRTVDYRLKGYRAPQSYFTPDLAETNLLKHNFEWLASSAYSFGFNVPRLQNRIVKIPILFDDHVLYKRSVTYQQWETRALETIAAHDFVAFSLHDCYAPYWLPHYEAFLQKIRELGILETLDHVATTVFLANAV